MTMKMTTRTGALDTARTGRAQGSPPGSPRSFEAVMKIKNELKDKFNYFLHNNTSPANAQDIIEAYNKVQEDDANTGFNPADGLYYAYHAGIPGGGQETGWTQGYGHYYGPSPTMPTAGWTSQQRDQQLRDDMVHRGLDPAKEKYTKWQQQLGGPAWDKLPLRQREALADYKFTGIDPSNRESNLSKAIRAAEDDTTIITEYLQHTGTNKRKYGAQGTAASPTGGQVKLYQDLLDLENPAAIGKILDSMDMFHESGDSRYVLNSYFPEMDADSQIATWKNELKTLRKMWENKTFNEKEVFKMEKIIGDQLMNSIGGGKPYGEIQWDY